MTLIEVLLTMVILVLVLSAALALLDMANKRAPEHVERAHVISDSQTMVDRMDRELRGATQLLSPTSASAVNAVEVVVPVWSSGTKTSRRVLYDCSAASPTEPALRSCFRYESDPSTPPGGAGELILDRVSNGTPADPVFTLSGSPAAYLRVHLKVPSRGERKSAYGYNAVFNDGVYMRNLGGGQP